jgi:hypothetical protein
MFHTAFAISNVSVPELAANASVQNALSQEEVSYLSEELRRQAALVLPESEYAVLAKNDSSAEYFSHGTIGKFGKKFTISIELYETKDGKRLSNVVSESEDIDGLLDIIRSKAKPMFQSILGSNPPIPAPAAAVPAVIPASSAAAPVQFQPSAPAPAVLAQAASKLEPPAPKGISKVCLDEVMSISGNPGFDMGKFIKDLPPAAVKVKLQLKSPFGKPKDGDKADIGMTVGCLKALPESPAEIGDLLKDMAIYIGFKTGKDFAADALSTALPSPASNSIPANVGTDESSGGVASTVIGLGLAVAGIGTVIYGIAQGSRYDSYYDDYKNARNTRDAKSFRDSAEDAKSSRNFGYVLGGILFAGGITVLIAF